MSHKFRRIFANKAPDSDTLEPSGFSSCSSASRSSSITTTAGKPATLQQGQLKPRLLASGAKCVEIVLPDFASPSVDPIATPVDSLMAPLSPASSSPPRPSISDASSTSTVSPHSSTRPIVPPRSTRRISNPRALRYMPHRIPQPGPAPTKPLPSLPEGIRASRRASQLQAQLDALTLDPCRTPVAGDVHKHKQPTDLVTPPVTPPEGLRVQKRAPIPGTTHSSSSSTSTALSLFPVPRSASHGLPPAHLAAGPGSRPQREHLYVKRARPTSHQLVHAKAIVAPSREVLLRENDMLKGRVQELEARLMTVALRERYLSAVYGQENCELDDLRRDRG